MDHGQTHERGIKQKDSTDVGNAGVEGFQPFGIRSNAQDCLQNQPVGKENEHSIHPQRREHDKEPKATVDDCTGTGQS